MNQTPMPRGDAVLVLGCGPVGLSTIAALRRAGHGPIVAADFSPKRRQLAEALGVDVVLDPGSDTPYETWAELAGDPDSAPPHTQVTVVGVCMQPDPILPVAAIMKELTVRFVFAYTSSEYDEAFRAIADGSVDVGPWVTAERPLEQSLDAFADLGAPDHHCKVVIRP